MKSHIAPENKVKKGYLTTQSAAKILAETLERFESVNAAATTLAAYEVSGIGNKRLIELASNYREWMREFAKYAHDDVLEFLVKRRLEERGLLDIFKEIEKKRRKRFVKHTLYVLKRTMKRL